MSEPGRKREEFCAHALAWAERFGLSLSAALCHKLGEHYELLLHWNERINLTRITEPEEAARFHYVESLYVGEFLLPSVRRIADVGSGGGFPGIPLAVVRPDMEVILIEKDRRRAIFLSEAIRRLGLENVEVVCERFQAYERRDFDALLCRALERMAERVPELLAFAEACRQVLLLGGSDLERAVRRHAGPRWTWRSLPIPYAHKRRMLLLEQSTP